MRYDSIYEVAESSATPGRVFTASIADEQIIPKDKYLDHMLLAVKGAVSTAAVAIETFAGLLSEYKFNAGSETRIQLTLRQLAALSAWFYKQVPFMWENTDNTGNDFLFGIKIPVQETTDVSRPLSHAATRTAVTNIGTETIALYAGYYTGSMSRKPIHAVKIDYTTPGATGLTNLGVKIPPIGKLIGLIWQSATPVADGTIIESIARVQIIVDGVVHTRLSSATHKGLGVPATVGVLDPIDDLFKVFCSADFRDEPIDLVGKTVELKLDVQETSAAVAIIPIIEKA